MSWWEYVERIKGADSQELVAAAVGIKASSVSRWKTGGSADPQQVARFARHYGRPVLEAFVEAEFLTPAEAKQRPAAAPSLRSLSDDQLVEEILRRMKEGGGRGGDTAPTKLDVVRPPNDEAGDGLDQEAARDVGREGSVTKLRTKQDQAGEPPVDDPDDMEPR